MLFICIFLHVKSLYKKKAYNCPNNVIYYTTDVNNKFNKSFKFYANY